ncbi:MAG TPA: DUF4279 domain-containing protein [Metabacillus sp.]|nr:DUF4279 domain-containing protein [Metabacillus sp.]
MGISTGSISSGSITFIIRGNQLDFDDITKNLKVQPTDISNKGEILPGGTEILEDAWFYEVKMEKCEEPNNSFKRLLDVLTSSESFIRNLSKLNNLCIRCYIQTDFAQIYLDFSPEIIQRLANLDIRLEFSILSWGGVESD